MLANCAVERFVSDCSISRLWAGATIEEARSLGDCKTLRGKYFYACHLYSHAKSNKYLPYDFRCYLLDISIDVFENVRRLAPAYEKVDEALQLSRDLKYAIERKKS